MAHMLERFALHFVSSAFVLLVFRFVYEWLADRFPAVGRFDVRWVGDTEEQKLFFCAMLVGLLFPLREPYDVWMGNNGILKAYMDTLSWWLGAGVAAWGVYRYNKIGRK